MLQWRYLKKNHIKVCLTYYKQLITLRKSQPALNNTDRKKTKAEADEKNKILIVQRWSDEQHLDCILNFSDKDQIYNWPEGNNNFQFFKHRTRKHYQCSIIIIFERR